MRKRTPSIPMSHAIAVGLAVGAIYLGWTYPALPHDWYTKTKDPETGFSCCGGYDCRPIPETSVKVEKGGWRYLPTGELVPFYRAQQSHDFKFHRCEYLGSFTSNKTGETYKEGDTRCFFVPGGTM